MSRKKPKISMLGHLPDKIRKAIGQIRELLIDEFHPDMIILFGSYADRIAAFHLHQVCESSYHMVELVHTRRSSKTHDLNELLDICLPFLPERKDVFPKDTDFSDRTYPDFRDATPTPAHATTRNTRS